MAAFTKRKVAPSGNADYPKKKRKMGKQQDVQNEKVENQEGFEIAHFKFMLRDKETCFQGLEKFIKSADSGKSSIIEDYVTSSLECVEIFEVMNRGLLKPTEVTLVFRSLEKILLHLSGSIELEEYFSVGKHVVTQLLTTHKRTVLFALNKRNKSAHIKVAIKLLTAMVMLGPLTAGLVLSSINFADDAFTGLMDRRDMHDKEDVRTCMLLLIVAFLLSEDKQVVRKLTEFRDFMESAFYGMKYDRATSVDIFLTTMLEKVVLSPGISKTLKMQLFTAKVLNSVGELFKWKGPVRHKDKIADQQEDLGAPLKRSEHVSEMAHKFLSEVCASYKHGLLVRDHLTGLSAKNNNRSVTFCLLNLTFHHKTPLASDLIVKSLSACPEQLPYYIPNMEGSLEPQQNKAWMDHMELVFMVYKSLPLDPPVLQGNEIKNLDQIVDLLMIYTCPTPKVMSVLNLGFKKKSILMNHILLKTVHVFAERAVHILSLLNGEEKQQSNVVVAEQTEQILALYRSAVMKALPEPKAMFDCLDVAQRKKDEEDLAKLQEMTDGSEKAVIVRIVQTFCLYQELYPAILVENHWVLARLIDGILQQQTGEEDYLPQVYLLKLLAGTDARRLPWSKQNKQGQSLMYQLLEMVSKLTTVEAVKDISLNLICKLLCKTGLFDGFEEELQVWIRPLQSQDGLSEDSSPLKGFVSSVLTSYMSNPYPYMDRVSDLMSDVSILKSGGHDQSGKDDEEKFKAVVAMEIDTLDDEEDLPTCQSVTSTTKRFPFCPMLLVALEMYKNQPSQSSAVKSYLSVVTVGVFHQQVDPTALGLQLQKCDTTGFLDGVLTYILTWLPAQSPKKKKKSSRSEEMLTVQRYRELTDKNSVLNPDSADPVCCVRQLLLHLTHVLACADHDEYTVQKVKSVLSDISDTIVNIPSTDSQAAETSPLTEQLPVLNDNNNKVAAPASCIKIVLTHPQVMEYFLHDVANSQVSEILTEVTQLITDFVIELLEISGDKMSSIRSVMEFFNEKVVSVLKKSSTLSETKKQEILPPIHRYMKLMIVGMDIRTCREVLNLLLTNSDSGTDISQVLVHLINKLISSPVKHIHMDRENVTCLITWFLETDDGDCHACLETFFKKFPAVSVLCGESLFESVLEFEDCGKLAVVLMQNNSHLQSKLGEMLVTGQGINAIQHQPVILDFLKIQNVRLSAEEKRMSEVMVAVKSMYQPLFLQMAGLDSATDKPEAVFEVFQLLLEMECIDKEHIVPLTKRVLKSMRTKNTSLLQPLHVKMVELLFKSPLVEMDANVSHALLHVCLECYTNTVSKPRRRNGPVETELLSILSRFEEEEMQNFPGTWGEFKEFWPVFVKKSLKYCYTDMKLLSFMTKFMPSVYADKEDVGVALETVVTMVMSHSSFLKVMFNEESPECKGALIDLLTQLLNMSPESCKKDHVPVMLAAYGGSLSLTDQKVLKLIHFYESEGIEFHKFRPFLWGEKAIEFQTLHPNDKRTLNAMKMGKMLQYIDEKKMKQTVLHFPLARRLLNYVPLEAEKMRGVSDSYDPCFFLSLFSFLLQPDRHVTCKQFIDTECLGFVLACLSSHDRSLRNAAYHVLDRFQLHLQEASIQGQEELLYLLKLMRNSLTETVSKLAPLITVFLARAVRLLFQPGEHMYGVIKSFLMTRPTLDVSDIPDFYKLFFSSDIHHRAERSWILSLMQDGLREIADFRIFEKRYTFKLLFSFYDTETADAESQVKVLQIVKAACKDRTMAVSLCNEHGVVTWISTAISKLTPEKKRHVTELNDILHTLWFTMLGKSDNSKEKTGHPEPIFTSQMMSLLQNVLWYFRDVKREVVQTYLQTLTSVVNHVKMVVSGQSGDTQAVTPSSLTCADCLVLLVYIQRYTNQDLDIKSVLNILSRLGYSIGLLENPKAEQLKQKEHLYPVEAVNDVPEPGDKTEADTADTEEILDVENEGTKNKNMETKEEEIKDPDTVIEEEICKHFLKLILSENLSELKSNRAELVAASLILVGWVVEGLESEAEPDTLLDGLKFVDNVWTENKTVGTVICSDSDAGRKVITGLLNLYSVISSHHGQTYVDSIQTLNSIMRKAVELKYGQLDSEMDNVDEEALTLRLIFVTDGAVTFAEKQKESQQTKRVKRTRKNEKMEVDGDEETNKTGEKSLSKELMGMSKVVENLHLKVDGSDDGGSDTGDEEEEMDEEEEEEEDSSEEDENANKEQKLSNRQKRKFHGYQYFVNAKRARTSKWKSSKKGSHGRKGR